MVDYYALLGLGRKATKDEIKKTYRDLVIQYHPDRNGGNTQCEERLKEINEAYQVLRDEGKRRDYDLLYQHDTSRSKICHRERNNSFLDMSWRFAHQAFSTQKIGSCGRRAFWRGGCTKRRWPM